MRRSSSQLLAGATSGFLSAVSLQPLDLLKTRLQQPGPLHGSIPGVLKQVVRNDGFFGLWAGTTPTLLRNVPGVAVYFYIMQTARSSLAKLPQLAVQDSSRPSSSSPLVRISPLGNLIAGAGSRTAVGLVLNPFTLLKARFESSFYTHRSLSASLREVLNAYGNRGLLQGFSATALRDAPYAGLFLVSYELAKDYMGPLHYEPLRLAACGALAASSASAITQPFDVIKTRMQVQPTEHQTLRQTSAMIFRERGVRGFLDGLSPRLAKKGLSSAISWAVYETLLKSLLAL